MGHSLITHTACYGQWTDQRTLEQAIAQSRLNRDQQEAQPLCQFPSLAAMHPSGELAGSLPMARA
jgi:hypothetical protein